MTTMPSGFWTSYAIALATIAIALSVLFVLGRLLVRKRNTIRPHGRLMRVAESAILSQYASLHVVIFADRYVLVGVGNAGLCALLTLRCDEVERATGTSVETGARST